MKISILSKYNGKVERGVENWAVELQKRFPEIQIINENYLIKYSQWSGSDVVIPVNGRFQIFFARFVTFLKGKKLVVFGHSGPGADDKWNLICMPDYFVAFSDYQKKWAEKYKLAFTKVVKISHAVDTDKFKPTNSIKKNIVLCVAANIPSKRIELVKNATEKLGNIEFKAYGEGNKYKVKSQQMPDVYNEAKVLAFTPEKWEAFGLVYLEALACNLPVVTIEDEVRREIVGNAGILVKKPENINELSDAIKNALMKNWGYKPRIQAENFSWSKIKKDYEIFFNNLK